MALAKEFQVEVVVPEGMSEGDSFTVTVKTPELPKQARGQLHGIALEDMTDEQLKREIINSKSVLYKAEKRGADAETVLKNKERVDAAMAEKAKRAPVAAATIEGEVAEDIDEKVAAEI